MKSKKANKFLEQHIFYDLENLNDGFDSESIKYFNKKDFEKILDRAEYFKLEIFGMPLSIEFNSTCLQNLLFTSEFFIRKER